MCGGGGRLRGGGRKNGLGACDDACVGRVPPSWLEEGLGFAADRRGKEECSDRSVAGDGTGQGRLMANSKPSWRRGEGGGLPVEGHFNDGDPGEPGWGGCRIYLLFLYPFATCPDSARRKETQDLGCLSLRSQRNRIISSSLQEERDQPT